MERVFTIIILFFILLLMLSSIPTMFNTIITYFSNIMQVSMSVATLYVLFILAIEMKIIITIFKFYAKK